MGSIHLLSLSKMFAFDKQGNSLKIPNKITPNFKNYIDNPVQIIRNMYENDINVMKSHLNTK